MLKITDDVIYNAVLHNFAWVKQQFFQKIKDNECPLLREPGFLFFTYDTLENFKVYFSHRLEEPKAFLGDEPLDDDDIETIESNENASFRYVEVSDMDDLLEHITRFYLDRLSIQLEEEHSSLLQKSYSNIESFKDTVFSKCLGSATVGLICENFLRKGCIDKRNDGHCDCPFF